MRFERRHGGIGQAIASALLPGLGQLINGETGKALLVFLVWLACSITVLRHFPLIGPLVAVIGALTWLYGVIDAWVARPPAS